MLFVPGHSPNIVCAGESQALEGGGQNPEKEEGEGGFLDEGLLGFEEGEFPEEVIAKGDGNGEDAQG